MAECVCVGDAELERDNVEIRQHRRGDTGRQQPPRDGRAAAAEPNGKWHRGMSQNSWHSVWIPVDCVTPTDEAASAWANYSAFFASLLKCLLMTDGRLFGALMRSCLLTLNLPNTTSISLTAT